MGGLLRLVLLFEADGSRIAPPPLPPGRGRPGWEDMEAWGDGAGDYRNSVKAVELNDKEGL